MKSKVLLLALLAQLLSLPASAYDAYVGGIYYNFSGDEAEVTYLARSYSDNYYAYTGSVTIPETITFEEKTYRVTSIGDYAFYSCHELTSVIIPDCIKSIGIDAFEYCPLTSVVIPNSVTSIGDGAFDQCWLGSVTIGSGVKSIGNFAFSMNSLTSVFIPKNVTNIGPIAHFAG